MVDAMPARCSAIATVGPAMPPPMIKACLGLVMALPFDIGVGVSELISLLYESDARDPRCVLGFKPPAAQQLPCRELRGGSCRTGKILGQCDRGVGQFESRALARPLLPAGVRDQQGRTRCGCSDLSRYFATGGMRVGRSQPGSSAIVAGVPLCSACRGGAVYGETPAPQPGPDPPRVAVPHGPPTAWN